MFTGTQWKQWKSGKIRKIKELKASGWGGQQTARVIRQKYMTCNERLRPFISAKRILWETQ